MTFENTTKSQKPVVDVFAVCWNEEKILPFFLEHYSFARKITLYDNHSTDKTVEIARTYKNVEVVTYDSGDECRDDIYLKIKNNCWKWSNADWVIVCDVDEFFTGNLDAVSATIVVPEGYNLIHKTFPQKLSEVTHGWRDLRYDKPCVFRPDQIREINFTVGCHVANPEGVINMCSGPDLRLLHYRFLGVEETLQRNQLRGGRISEWNKRNGGARNDKFGGEDTRATLLRLADTAPVLNFL